MKLVTQELVEFTMRLKTFSFNILLEREKNVDKAGGWCWKNFIAYGATEKFPCEDF